MNNLEEISATVKTFGFISIVAVVLISLLTMFTLPWSSYMKNAHVRSSWPFIDRSSCRLTRQFAGMVSLTSEQLSGQLRSNTVAILSLGDPGALNLRLAKSLHTSMPTLCSFAPAQFFSCCYWTFHHQPRLLRLYTLICSISSWIPIALTN